MKPFFTKNDYGDRSWAELKEHYRIEKDLASKIMASDHCTRKSLYSKLYEELFESVPNHPQLKRKNDERKINLSKTILNRIEIKDKKFLEIGPGDCALAIEVSKYASKVYAADVSSSITKLKRHPKNLEIILFDGIDLPDCISGIDIAFSNHVIEHLHPVDFINQTKSVYNALNKGGFYVCVTPNRINGPHDISKYFDKIATGFHLKEYSTTELVKILNEIGFGKIKILNGSQGKYFEMNPKFTKNFEALLEKAPRPIAKGLATSPLRLFLGINLIAIK